MLYIVHDKCRYQRHGLKRKIRQLQRGLSDNVHQTFATIFAQRLVFYLINGIHRKLIVDTYSSGFAAHVSYEDAA